MKKRVEKKSNNPIQKLSRKKKRNLTILLAIIVLFIIVVFSLNYFDFYNWNTTTDDNTNNYEEPSINPDTSVTRFYKEISVTEAKKLVDSGNNLVIMDFSSSYSQGHIPGAINYNLETLDQAILQLDKTKDYLVYAKFDSVSRPAAEKLVNAGFNVYRLKGNYGTWVYMGYPIEK